MEIESMYLRSLGRQVGITIKNGEVINKHGRGPLAGAHASLETSGDIERRITATRLVPTGPFALAFRKKKDNRTLWLTITGANNSFEALAEVDPKHEKKARQFVAEFNTTAAKAAAQLTAPDNQES